MLVASIAGFQPGPRMAVYFASKAYVLSLGEALAYELRGSGVTVTTLCPGATATDFFDVAGAAQIGDGADSSPDDAGRQSRPARLPRPCRRPARRDRRRDEPAVRLGRPICAAARSLPVTERLMKD